MLRNKIILVVLAMVLIGTSLIGQNVSINEFMAVNKSILQDEDGDYSDWIELYNSGTANVSLKGWYLTDDKNLPSKWIFPDIAIPAKNYLIVYASGKDKSTSELHANFKLSGDGEYLALMNPGANQIISEYEPEYPVQYADISYGSFNSDIMYFANATPGAENVRSLFLVPPIFTVQHGFYEKAFDLELIKSSDEIEIYYTLDASTPSNTNGTLYSTPINIATTTVIRAVSYNSTNGLSTTVTSSYIFAEDVKSQSNDQPGYPTTWLTPIHGTDDYDRIPANYDMKADFINTSEVSDVLTESLKSLPVISIVTDIDNLFSESTDPDLGGIYTYNGEPDGPTINLEYHLGRGWKRAASVEYFNSDELDGSLDFQANCAIKIHGGATRTRAKTEKHSFKIGFKSEYGPSKLEEKVFGKGSPKKYDWLILRGGFAPRLGLQVKDPWAKLTMRDMGQYASYNKFVHVFINGLYWGMYNLSERMDENCMRDNLGGSADDYDIVKDYYEVEAGDTRAWDKLVAYAKDEIDDPANYQYLLGNNSDGTPNAAYDKLLNDENLLDYMIMNIYAGTGDWDHHNWAAARRKTNSEGFHFLTWDAEGVFKDVSVGDIVNKSKDNRPTGVFADLLMNEQFKNKFIGKVNMHFFEEGALTPQPCLERYEKILGAIDSALICDQARWVYDENDIWNTSYHDFIYDYFPPRTERVFTQLVSEGLYPIVDFPRFSNGNNTFADTVDLFMNTSSEGEILYTLDGTDPGYFKQSKSESIFVYDNMPLPLEIGTNIVTARVKQDSLWSRLITKKFTVKSTSTTTLANRFTGPEENLHSYPNPIENDVQIAFSLLEPAQISIRVYNVFGTEVASVLDEYISANEYALNWNAGSLSPGMYICVFENKTKATISKVKLIKK
jgi:hypothetical protein